MGKMLTVYNLESLVVVRFREKYLVAEDLDLKDYTGAVLLLVCKIFCNLVFLCHIVIVSHC